MKHPVSEQAKRTITRLNHGLIAAYKGFGIFALAAILLGLIGFLTVNVFYLFDRSWVRPVILSPTHERVVRAQAELAEQNVARGQLELRKDALNAELIAVERTVELANKLEKSYARVVDGDVSTVDELMARRELDRALLEREQASARKHAIANELRMLEASIGEYQRIIDLLRESPFVLAAEQELTVAFAPYENLDNVTAGAPIYACKWGLIRCGEVGEVVRALPGEVTNSHPHDSSSRRGIMFEIKLDERWAAEESALFVGGKPFWIF